MDAFTGEVDSPALPMASILGFYWAMSGKDTLMCTGAIACAEG